MIYNDRILSSSLTILILFALISTSSYAANRRPGELPWYEIEILIFANTEQKGLDTETWPENEPGIIYDHLINLRFPKKKGLASISDPNSPENTAAVGPDGQTGLITETDVGLPEAFAFINKSEFRLSNLRKKLTSSSRYEPLMHLGWRQPTAKPKKALPVYLHLGVDDPNFRSALEAVGADSAAAATSSNFGLQPTNAMDYPVGPKNARLYGALTLSVSRYLHVDTDLHYRAPVLQQEYVLEQPDSGFFDSTAEPVERLIERNVLLDFSMVESRRLRSKEVHFFDHPLFGMIVLITPVDVTGDS